MIRLVEDIEHYDYVKVALDSKNKDVFIEIASNRKIDIAVVDEALLEEFDESDDGADVEIEWIENTRNHDFEYSLPDKKKRYLLFWNANEDDDAIVAYKITPIV